MVQMDMAKHNIVNLLRTDIKFGQSRKQIGLSYAGANVNESRFFTLKQVNTEEFIITG